MRRRIAYAEFIGSAEKVVGLEGAEGRNVGPDLGKRFHSIPAVALSA